jgi:hypothetical protein
MAGAMLVLVQPVKASPGQWTFTGSLSVPHSHHTATLLQNGLVLVAGGYDDFTGETFANADLYDPATGVFTPTGQMNVARGFHTATLLPSGMVLVAGGGNTSAELYDPASGTWSLTGSLRVSQYNANAVLLNNGKVLVACGGSVISQLYDPTVGKWSQTGSTTVDHSNADAPVPMTLLPNGLVLIEGGLGDHAESIRTAELYDPATGIWTATGSLGTAREGHTATLLSNGLVLVAGGADGAEDLATAELYDPASGTWTPTGSLSTGHYRHTSTLLSNGMVLVASGIALSFTNVAELYDPMTAVWTMTGNLNTARADYTATLLPDGMVLAAGGFNGGIGDLSSAELYDPLTTAATTVNGRGTINTGNGRATFNFHATDSNGRPTGTLSYSDTNAGISIPKARIRSLTITGNSADFGGTANVGGSNVTFDVNITDNGDGTSDTFSITLSNGYSASGNLTRGDIQIF